MTTDIQTAARALMEAAGRQRLERLRDIAQRRMLCRAKIQEANESRERLARLDAEYARVEAQTAADIAREALEPAQEKPEPYRAGLPPERLRKVLAEWEMVDGVVYVFRGNKYRCAYRPPTEWWDIGAEHTWRASYRPHGKTWSEVEAMADAAEKPAEPKMLDLRTVPPGTVCEATGQIARGSHVILPGERFAFAGSSTEFLARVRVIERDESFDAPTVVYARVVEVPR